MGEQHMVLHYSTQILESWHCSPKRKTYIFISTLQRMIRQMSGWFSEGPGRRHWGEGEGITHWWLSETALEPVISHHKTPFVWESLTSAYASQPDSAQAHYLSPHCWGQDYQSVYIACFLFFTHHSLKNWKKCLFVCRSRRRSFRAVTSRVPAAHGAAALLPVQNVTASVSQPELLLHHRTNLCWTSCLFDPYYKSEVSQTAGAL